MKFVSKFRYSIEVDDLGVEYADEGAWRSYSLESEGNTYADLIDNAGIYETDQDGGSLRDYPLTSVGGELYKAGEKAIDAYWERKHPCACTSDALCRSHSRGIR